MRVQCSVCLPLQIRPLSDGASNDLESLQGEKEKWFVFDGT